MPISAAYESYTRPWGGGSLWGGKGQPSLQHTARRRQRMRELGLIGPEITPTERMSVQEAQELQAGRVAQIRGQQAEEREMGEQAEQETDLYTGWKEAGATDAQARSAARMGKQAPIKKDEGPVRETKAQTRTAEATSAGILQQRVQGLLQDLQSPGSTPRVKQLARAELRSLDVDIPEHLERGYLEPPELPEKPLSLDEQVAFAGRMREAGRAPAKTRDWQRSPAVQQQILDFAKRLADARGGTKGDAGRISNDAQALLAKYEAGNEALQDEMYADMTAGAQLGDPAAKVFLRIASVGAPIPPLPTE